jgi:hypothetical protein
MPIESSPNDGTEASLRKAVTLLSGESGEIVSSPNDSTEESLRKVVTLLGSGAGGTGNTAELIHSTVVGPNTDKIVTFNQSGGNGNGNEVVVSGIQNVIECPDETAGVVMSTTNGPSGTCLRNGDFNNKPSYGNVGGLQVRYTGEFW